MSSAPYFKFYFSDLAGDTLFLSDAEMGSYVLLLGAMWNAGGALPNDPSRLGRVARVTPAKWPRRWAAIARFFVVDGDEVTHQRIKSERKKVADISTMRSEIGTDGAKAKARKKQETAEAIASRDESNSDHNPEARVQRREKDEPSLSPAAPAAPRASASRRKALTTIPEAYPNAVAMMQAESLVTAARVHLNVASHGKRFRRHATSKGRQERDWEAAWLGWIEIEIEKAPPKVERVASPQEVTWEGPSDVWAAIEGVWRDHARTAAYLAKCTWQDSDRTLLSESPTVVDTLKREAGPTLAGIDVRIVLERGRGRSVA